MSDRWCPRCNGVKRPSEAICLACGITLKHKRQTLEAIPMEDLRLLRAALTVRDTVRRNGVDFTYSDIVDELLRRDNRKHENWEAS
jgi:hypothetical protein